MIRIDLLHRKRNRLRPVLMGTGGVALAAVLLLASLYWIDQRYPLYGVWSKLWMETPREETTELATLDLEEERREVVMLREEREPVVNQTDSLREEVVWLDGVEEEVPQEMARDTVAGESLLEEPKPVEEEVVDSADTSGVVAEEEVAAVGDADEEGREAPDGERMGMVVESVAEDSTAVGDADEEGREAPDGERVRTVAESVAEDSIADSGEVAEEQADNEEKTAPIEEINRYRSALRWSAACLWAVKLSERLPAGARLTSLTCRASGEYSLEGMSGSRKEVEGFLETLEQLPSQVSLSWWREGSPRVGQVYQFKFNFLGQFEELYTRELEHLSASQAQVLAEKIADWARQSGLGELALEEPIETMEKTGSVQRRQKVWATGSYAQIGAFLQRLKQVEDVATLGEVVIVPVYREPQVWERARLYAAVDVLMHRP